jgi:hypothetical protein
MDRSSTFSLLCPVLLTAAFYVSLLYSLFHSILSLLQHDGTVNVMNGCWSISSENEIEKNIKETAAVIPGQGPAILFILCYSRLSSVIYLSVFLLELSLEQRSEKE